MNSLITKYSAKLTKKLSLLFLLSTLGLTSGCLGKEEGSSSLDHLEKKELIVSNEKLTIYVVHSGEDHAKGLSGIRDKDFGPKEGMLFWYKTEGVRRFWMPDTYFDLDIFFLDKDFVVIDIERDVPHHPGKSENPPIYRTREISCRHVLELRADSPYAKKIKLGHKLNLMK
jgi:hypothetical protein